ncbi:Metallo-beta-lactamase superfamily [Nocardia farcinica]|uniref:MBL fold metallo-hydrolase n=1 Tax=Nocardia farcinica TaxID=37329 RepID=UPI000E06F735|nr:MBL fold metallo-hydrolase [Nocardia farcinica]SUE28937.1 Metallo-beta-lactamase superfamily [Nocardia farcinica]
MTLSLERFTRPAGTHSHQLGDHRITYLPDGVALLEPRLWLPGSDDQIWSQNQHLINPDGYLVASVGALLVEYGNRAMLIDAGFGPLAVPTPFGSLRGGQLLESLAVTGKSLADIELVAITHLHLDHVGWLWQSDTGSVGGSPFADLPVLVGETEWQRQDLAIADGAAPEMLDVFASQVRTVADGQEIFPGVHVMAAPGHSLGHLAYIIASPGHRLIAFGDAMHTPLQITRPDLTSAADDDPIAASNTSRQLISEMTAPGTLGFGMHFADTQLGRVAASAEGKSIWEPQ